MNADPPVPVRWIPTPQSLPAGGRGGRAGRLLFTAILTQSGRLEAIYRARGEAAQHRMVMALFRGPRAVEVVGSDRDIAARVGMAPRSVGTGLAFLERTGHCVRCGRGADRRIRLCLPEAQEVAP